MTDTTQPPAQPTPATAPKTSTLAIAAFVLALIPCIGLIGAILGIVALVRISRRPALGGQGLAIAAIAVGIVWSVFGGGCISAIAIPNFLKFQARAKQSEAKANLKAVFTGQKMVFAENGRCATTFEELGFDPGPNSLYTYYVADDRLGPDLPLPESARAFVRPETGEFQAAAVGNIDADPTLDVWIIDDQNALTNVVNDVEE